MSNTDTLFPVNRIDEIISHPENFRMLEKIPLTIDGVDSHFPIKLNDVMPGDKTSTVIFLDTETTGLDYKSDNVIELGMVKATYSMTSGRIISVDGYLDLFEDPGKPIPPEITRLTGITDDMVADQKFDDAKVANFMAGKCLIVAHNAGFDRPFFEKRFKNLLDKNWACSLKEIPWKTMGFSSSKLEFLNSQIGYFYNAHRAYVDCLALLWILYQTPEAFEKLLENARKKSYKNYLFGNTFRCKDAIKNNGFRFETLDNGEKCWSKTYDSLESAKNDQEIILNAYNSDGANLKFIPHEPKEFTAKTRYKS